MKWFFLFKIVVQKLNKTMPEILTLEKYDAKISDVNLEVSVLNNAKKYFVHFTKEGKYPVTKEFYEELDFLFKSNRSVFSDYVKTMLRLLPNLQAS